MNPYDVVYLGRSRFHQGWDAASLHFRVMQNGRYCGAYAGVVSGPDLVSFAPKPPAIFWATLAHLTTNAIAARLLAGRTPTAKPHESETIWVKAVDIRAQGDPSFVLPVEGEIFRAISLEEDLLAEPQVDPAARILSVGSSSISLRAAAAARVT
jgi:hypothetical protein